MNMSIGTVIIKLHAPWVHSLKEKRMIIRSLTAKVRNHFNVSINEVDEMDIHQIIVLGVSCISNSEAQANSVIDKVIDFIERNTEAQVTEVEIDIL